MIKVFKSIKEFLSHRIELMLFIIALALMVVVQSFSASIDKDYASYGISWMEELVFDHVKAFNVLIGVWIVIRLVFNKSYSFLSNTLEKVIGNEPLEGEPDNVEKNLTLWQRSLLSLGLFFLLVLVYVLT